MRIISTSNLGWGDFGASFYDNEVDGFVPPRDDPDEEERRTRRQSLPRVVSSPSGKKPGKSLLAKK